MEQQTVTLVIGLAGIAGTLVSSGLGFYFTAKARRNPLREALFDKQLDIISRIMHKGGRIRVFATILTGKDEGFRDQARNDMGECVREFSEIQEESDAILPTELWVEVKHLTDHMVKLLVRYDEDGQIEPDDLARLLAMSAKVGLLSRAVIGVDELTDESLALFSSKKSYQSLAEIEVEHFERMSDDSQTNKQGS
ncbi:MAG TPA: hypothetical protein VNY51_06430 [Candidatus Dormibacteraeota bacterium]|jgi:hypothetical protein|nr:hypothetical protein [Candidatus Dormibacteraeota bacterium]